MSQCPADPLLQPGAAQALATGLLRYPPMYDEVLSAVGSRLRAHGAATKLDLTALVFWKHIRTSPWMKRLLERPEADLREATATALAPGLADGERIHALAPVPGFGTGGAVTSTFFAAWNPRQYGVYDRFVAEARLKIVVPACSCTWADLPTYWEHLRKLAEELSPARGPQWTPRMVDQAMLNL
jgi:uncharacterized protein (DUF1501 family)